MSAKSIQAASGQAQPDPALLQALAEASAWIVTLHGPERSSAVEQGFREWLNEDPQHRFAFEHATDTWNTTRAGVRRSAQFEVKIPGATSASYGQFRQQAGVRRFALAASLVLAIGATVFFLQGESVTTGIGERRTVALADGTQVTLNTATGIVIDYSKRERRVRLKHGEALFEIAQDATRPFVVEAGERKVTALGTSFLVRRDDGQTTVTLVDGKIAVTSIDTPRPAPAEGPEARKSEGTPAVAGEANPEHANGQVFLSPGQRITFTKQSEPRIDRPQLQKLTAWQQGVVNIDDMTLAQAAAEMNRYNAVQLEVRGPAAQLRVSGIFRLTDSGNLARAVSLTHGLRIQRQGDRIVLSGDPRPPSESQFRANQNVTDNLQ